MLKRTITCLILFAALAFGVLLTVSQAEEGSAVNLAESREHLELAKLKQEIRKLELENEKTGNAWEILIGLAPFITSLVALIGVYYTYKNHAEEQKRQRDLDRKNAEAERIRRFDEKFNAIVENLGSEIPAIQASAAVSIQTFLKPEYTEFQDQVFLILLANLKVQHSDVIQKLLTAGFEKAIRVKSEIVAAENERIEEKDQKTILDLSGCALDRINLAKINLGWAYLRDASLVNANLKEGCLVRIRGERADFKYVKASGSNFEKARLKAANFVGASLSAANLKWVHFEEADLSDCRFKQALLQGAHFEKSVLIGAHFEQADINNAFFTKADLDIDSKKSIVKSYNWRKAHFDPEVLEELEQIEVDMLEEKKAQQKTRV